ncbi:putative ubiquitin-conjugating enzyme E2 R521 [Dissostichus eleginoides]|uniref:Ubiquitin-conjugating enzyme E2 R521 n=1 Tax=Dissostichus eleginoides TaxID=100907 RepID=A0AAD9F2K9_DISEL|nr:putative ubiquitin-conjugating enzyme E2 R521 [Dissostichus eleginoides]
MSGKCLQSSLKSPSDGCGKFWTKSSPDLFSAVKVWASSSVEIAAASVRETRLVQAVQNIEADIKKRDELKGTEDAEAPAAEELIQEDTPAPVEAPEDEEVLLSEEPAASAPMVEELAEEPAALALMVEEVAEEPAASAPMVEELAEEPAAVVEEVAEEPAALALMVEEVAEEPAAVVEEVSEVEFEEAAPEEDVSSPEPSPEDAAPAEEEAVPTAVVDTSQLAAASSGSEEAESTVSSEAAEAEHCHSCHSAPSEAEEEAPPAASGEQLSSEEAVDFTHDVKEEVFLVEGQATETMLVVAAQS